MNFKQPNTNLKGTSASTIGPKNHRLLELHRVMQYYEGYASREENV